MKLVCFALLTVSVLVASPVWAKPATKAIPVYDIAKIRASCQKMGKIARWNEKAQRCELVKKQGLPPVALVSIGLAAGAAVAAAVVIVAVTVSSHEKPFRTISTKGNSGLW